MSSSKLKSSILQGNETVSHVPDPQLTETFMSGGGIPDLSAISHAQGPSSPYQANPHQARNMVVQPPSKTADGEDNLF